MKKKILLLIAALSFTELAHAKLCPPCRSGFYVLGNVGYAVIQTNRNLPAEFVNATGPTLSNTSAQLGSNIGVNAGAGYQINDYMALESTFNYYFKTQKDNFNFTSTTTNGSGTYTQKNIYGVLVMAKGIVPLPSDLQCFDIYLKVGGAYMWTTLALQVNQGGVITHSSSSDNRFRLAYGLGADYNITPRIAAFLDWSVISGGTSNTGYNGVNTTLYARTPTINFYSAGLKYFFG